MADTWISKTLYKNGVLKNKLGIRDGAELARLEYRISGRVALRLLQRHLKVNTIDDLCKIHKLMFASLYPWAGKLRPGDFRKGDSVFFPYERFDYAREDIDNTIASLQKKKTLSNKDYAILLDKINYFHPFREGNGRSTKTFLQCLAANHGQVINYPLNNDQMIAAQEAADIERIAQLINVERIAD